uniref:Uncharacterized protein n=1 Tax=Bursaphelenchus xylophilus TaxID=6326 RepID=A0A1I7SRI4_BURXY
MEADTSLKRCHRDFCGRCIGHKNGEFRKRTHKESDQMVSQMLQNSFPILHSPYSHFPTRPCSFVVCFYVVRCFFYLIHLFQSRILAELSRHPNKFRSIVHSYLAIKQNPQRHLRNKSIPENEEPKENEPLITQRNTERRSHFKSSDSEKRKRMDRLFASPDDSSKSTADATITTADPSEVDSHRPDRPLEYSDIQIRLD